MSLKDEVRALIDRLPDDCTIEDMQYHLFVLDQIRNARDSLRRGEGIPHDEVKRRMAERISKSFGP